ncbi:unnamed protein product, partial [Musa hybrid cultivar]
CLPRRWQASVGKQKRADHLSTLLQRSKSSHCEKEPKTKKLLLTCAVGSRELLPLFASVVQFRFGKNMQDLFPVPSCFSSGEKLSQDALPAATAAAATRSRQSMVVSVYRSRIGGETVEVFWDLHSAKFCNEPEPQSDYYVAVVSEGEVVLLLGDLRKEAYRRTSSRPSLIEAVLVARKEHVFGKKRFATRSRFHDKGSRHEISVECSNGGGGGNMDLDMEIKIDGNVVIHVKHLQWKFRGNDSISIDKRRVEVYWDVHGWLFASGLRHALFIFKPESLSSAGGGGGTLKSKGIMTKTEGTIYAANQLSQSENKALNSWLSKCVMILHAIKQL